MLKDVLGEQINKEIHLKILVKYIFYLVKDDVKRLKNNLLFLDLQLMSFHLELGYSQFGILYYLIKHIQHPIKELVHKNQKKYDFDLVL